MNPKFLRSEILATFATVMTGILVAVTMYYLFQQRNVIRLKGLKIDVIKDDLKIIHSELKSAKAPVAKDQKRESFLNVAAISFHYAEKNSIRNFYNDYFTEPTVSHVVSEIVKEVSGDVEAKLPTVLEAKAGGKDLTKWISTIKVPDVSLSEMFRRYQRETILNNQVTLGLELLEIDLAEVDSFDKSITKLSTEFGFKVDPSAIDGKRKELKCSAAEKTLVRLEKATGWVLIDQNL